MMPEKESHSSAAFHGGHSTNTALRTTLGEKFDMMSWLGLAKHVGTTVSRAVCGILRVPPVVPVTPVLASSALHIQHSCYSSLTTMVGRTTGSFSVTGSLLQKIAGWNNVGRRSITLEYMHRKGAYKKVRKKRRHPLEGNPQLRGVVLKTLIKKPKKPNSANRKCVRLRLSNGKEVTAYVPGEGHNLQEHNVVLVEGGRLQDTPGVKLTCVRGKYDLPHVKKK